MADFVTAKEKGEIPSAMTLPFLPGNSFDKNLGKSRFHKSHSFDYNDDVPVCVGEKKPGIGGEPLPGQSRGRNTSVYPDGVGTGQPSWVAFDRQVLRFYAYFQEAIEEKQEERYRIRNCVILFYLEDDSIQVNEQAVENSGIPQGTLIRRHCIPLPPPCDDQFYTVEDFNVGRQIQLYSKIFEITGCDMFTENFLRKLGVKVPSHKDPIQDPYTQHRQKMLAAMQPQRPYEKLDTLKQFLDHDRHVLRFYCYWDDTDNMFGDPRELVLHYFLADDTIEIQEKIPVNSGRDAVPMFLKRAKLPKVPTDVRQPGVMTKRTVLNVFGPTGYGGRYILDALKTGAVHDDYYHESDLAIGAVLYVWGRRVIICDADDFTKEFYRTKYGIDKFDPIQFPQPTPRTVKPQIPPYNGVGSEEDSLASCLHLIPKPPRRDFAKFMEKDRHGLDSNVLRFVAKLNTSNSIDAERQFIVFYHLSDDTITIYEPPVRNSGIIGGKFLERGRVAKSSKNSTDQIVYYQAEDLYVGAEVVFNNFRFVLVDADEYAFRYMETHVDTFPHANINLILEKLKGPATAHIDKIRSVLSDADPNKTGTLPYETFKILVKGLAQGLLNDHEVLTLGRQYGEKKWPPLSSLIRIIQDDMKKKNFTQFDELLSALRISDSAQTGYIDKEELEHVCRTICLPLSEQLVEASTMNCLTDDQGRVNYEQFVAHLNWRDNPASPEKNKPIAGSTGTWTGFGNDRDSVTNIAYITLIEDLTKN